MIYSEPSQKKLQNFDVFGIRSITIVRIIHIIPISPRCVINCMILSKIGVCKLCSQYNICIYITYLPSCDSKGQSQGMFSYVFLKSASHNFISYFIQECLCKSTLRFGRRKTIVHRTMCALPEAISAGGLTPTTDTSLFLTTYRWEPSPS